jgi:predicted flap endonuclease-1-like 5' DNA nuclease
MQDFVAAYWMWLVVALLVGGAIGYWLLRRLGPQGGRAARVDSAPHQAVALAERTRAAVKSAQDEAAVSASTIEDARLAVEAKAAEVTRIAASAKAAEDARLAIEVKAAEAARIAAAAKATEDARLAVDAKAAEVTRIAAAAKAAGDTRLAGEAKTAEAARIATAAESAEADRLAAAAEVAEGARIAAIAKAAEEARVAAEAKAVEEARIAAVAKAAEAARVAADAKAAKRVRTTAAAKADEEARSVVEARIAAGAREAAAKIANDPGVAATASVADAGTSHPGSKPAGIAAPPDGETDDLKLIKGIGPKNEKACNALGIYQFRQIADWTPDEAVWVGHHMAFPGRIEREHWIAQARLLASGGETEHARAVKSGSLVVDGSADEPLDQASAELLAQSLPAQAATVEGEDKHAGRRPYGLASAVGQPDNLKKIRGIGPQNERRLHALGIWHFSQIAAWSEDNVKWVGSYLAFAGRIDREKWVAQARDLAAGKDTEFSRRVAAGKVATSKDDGANG